MAIFYHVAEITDPAPELYAVLALDTDKTAGDGGCEAKVISLHMKEGEAEAAANALRHGLN